MILLFDNHTPKSPLKGENDFPLIKKNYHLPPIKIMS